MPQYSQTAPFGDVALNSVVVGLTGEWLLALADGAAVRTLVYVQPPSDIIGPSAGSGVGQLSHYSNGNKQEQ